LEPHKIPAPLLRSARHALFVPFGLAFPFIAFGRKHKYIRIRFLSEA
jgi:hypothetical protein